VKISVAIAAYCGEKYIGEQLASIAAQSRVPDEVVIGDDSPDDRMEKVIRDFSGMLNIRYFRNEFPLGAAANFNRVLSEVAGNVVFLCDQDDLWYPTKVAEMSRVLAGGGLKGVFCDSTVTDAEAHPLGFSHFDSRGYSGLRKDPDRFLKNQFEASLRRFPAAGHDMALTGELLEKLLPIPELSNCHDNYLGVGGAALDAWECIPKELGIFRRHEKSTSQAGKKLTLAAQLKAAKESIGKNTFAWNAVLFQSVADRLPDLPAERRELLLSRVRHSRNREAMNTGFVRRAGLIWQEIRSGNYRRFGRGWKNVIQDLFLR
jgi:glycosyltransferase involved in cell wall biosynthesis